MPPFETLYECWPGGGIGAVVAAVAVVGVGAVAADGCEGLSRYWDSLRCRAIRCALGDVRCGKSISTYFARSGGVARDCTTYEY